MSVKMTDGKHVRKIHAGNAEGCGHAFMFAPWKRVNQYAACYEGAERNLVERMERRGWRVI